MFRCPYCGYLAKTFSALRQHCNIRHDNGECIVCGKKFKHVAKHLHAQSQHDPDHLLAYGLIKRHRTVGSSNWWKECRQIAYELTMVNEDEDGS